MPTQEYSLPKFSENLIQFFSFRDSCKTDISKSYGYDKGIVSYDFLEQRAHTDDPRVASESLFGSPGFKGLVGVRFDEYNNVRSRLVKTARILYGLDQKDSVVLEGVDQHIACSTNPFMVTALINSRDLKRFYIKRPSIERAIGKAFYNLLVDERFITYHFNEEGFAVDTVPGKEIEDSDRPKLLKRKNFVEEVVRLNVFTNLILLADVLKGTNANCCYSSGHGIYLFDFDRCFTDDDYYVLSSIKDIRNKVHVQSIERSERYRTFKNLIENRERVKDLLEVVREDMPKEALAWTRGEDNLADVLKKEFDKLGNWD